MIYADHLIIQIYFVICENVEYVQAFRPATNRWWKFFDSIYLNRFADISQELLFSTEMLWKGPNNVTVYLKEAHSCKLYACLTGWLGPKA